MTREFYVEEELRKFSPGLTGEWRSVCTARHNVLLEGPAASTEAVVRLLEPHLREPVAWKRPRAPLELPTGECGALVLQDIAALGGEEQTRLLGLLDDGTRRKQVVSTTTHPLFPLVARGLFDEALYYRLNVVLLHVVGSRFKASPIAD